MTADSDVITAFRRLVNLNADELDAWLATDRSHEVGFRAPGQAESVGHAAGRWISDLLRVADDADFLPTDIRHMRKTIGYIKRHTAQRPRGDVRDSRWRASLMNWGHDPLRS